MPIVSALAAWLLMLALAVCFGAARDFLLAPALGDGPARALGTLALCAALWAVAARFVRRKGVHGGRALCLGFIWAGMTLAFEFGFGFGRGLPLEAMLADYDIASGRLWVLVPLTLILAPLVSGRKKGRDAF